MRFTLYKKDQETIVSDGELESGEEADFEAADAIVVNSDDEDGGVYVKRIDLTTIEELVFVEANVIGLDLTDSDEDEDVSHGVAVEIE